MKKYIALFLVLLAVSARAQFPDFPVYNPTNVTPRVPGAFASIPNQPDLFGIDLYYGDNIDWSTNLQWKTVSESSSSGAPSGVAGWTMNQNYVTVLGCTNGQVEYFDLQLSQGRDSAPGGTHNCTFMTAVNGDNQCDLSTFVRTASNLTNWTFLEKVVGKGYRGLFGNNIFVDPTNWTYSGFRWSGTDDMVIRFQYTAGPAVMPNEVNNRPGIDFMTWEAFDPSNPATIRIEPQMQKIGGNGNSGEYGELQHSTKISWAYRGVGGITDLFATNTYKPYSATNLLSTNWVYDASKYAIYYDSSGSRYMMWVPYVQTSTPAFFTLRKR